MATWRKVSLLSKIQKGVTFGTFGNRCPEEDARCPQETVKQRLTAVAARLKRYTREVETRRINRLFSNNPSKANS